jgi:hypothetical protein
LRDIAVLVPGAWCLAVAGWFSALRHAAPPCNSVVKMPQWDFLSFPARAAAREHSFLEFVFPWMSQFDPTQADSTLGS